MTEHELAMFAQEYVRLKAKNSNVIYEAYASDFEDSYDNDPGEASITLRMPYGAVEFCLSEIESIEIIDKK